MQNSRRSLRFIFLGVLALTAFCGSLDASVPEWLAAANKADIAALGAGSAAVIVDRRVEFSVAQTGKFVMKERGAIRIFNRQAAERYLHIVGQEDSDQSVVLLHSWTIGRDGRVVESDKKDIVSQTNFAGFELYSDSKVKMISAPGAEDGSLIGYEIVTEGIDYIKSMQFSLERDIPVLFSEVTASVPMGSLRFFVNFPDRVEIVNQSANTVTIRAKNRPAIKIEEDMPPLRSLAATLYLNYDPAGNDAISGWETAAKIIHPMYSERRQANEEIRSEVQTLVAGKADSFSKLAALTDFVSRKIRYVAVEIGIGGYQPHAPSDVYRLKYGDCKDKANLLLTMMDQAGLRGYAALIGTRGNTEADPKIPSLGVFNHVIVAVPVDDRMKENVEGLPAFDKEHEILWIDPTSTTHSIGELPEMDQGVHALIDRGGRGEIAATPEIPAVDNGLDYRVSLRLQEGGRGAAEVEVSYFGEMNASRHAFHRNRSQSELRKYFEGQIAHYAHEARLDTVVVGGVEDNSDTITEKYSFSGIFESTSSGDSWFFQPLFLTGMLGLEIGGRARVHPLDWGLPHQIHGKYEIELPPNSKVDRVPDAVSMQTDFGTIEINYSVQEQTLIASYHAAYSMSRIPVERYDEFRNFLNKGSRLARQRLRIVRS